MKGRQMRLCSVCGAEVTSRIRSSVTCSKRCWNIVYGRVLGEVLPRSICALPECDVEFQPIRRNHRCCCEDHGRTLARREYRTAGREVREPWNDARKNRYHQRRALRQAASTGEPVLMSEIAARDDWRCGICSDPIDSAARWPDPWSASLDHVVPLSMGGAHDPENVQLAHLRCNVSKGSRVSA